MQKIGNTVIAILFTFLKKMWTSSMVFYFRAIFLSFLTTKISGNLLQICINWIRIAFKKQLDSAQHCKKTAGSGSAKKEYGSTALNSTLLTPGTFSAASA